MAHTGNLTTQEAEVQRLEVQGQLDHIGRPFSYKNLNKKGFGNGSVFNVFAAQGTRTEDQFKALMSKWNVVQ